MIFHQGDDMMRIEHLILFREICESKSISKVSSNNYLSRSTLSGLMSRIEQELGFELFKRSKKGIQLTDKGRLIYEQSESICATYKEWLKLNEDDSTIKDTIAVGVNSFYARNLLNEIILKCNELYPNITLLLSIVPPGRHDLLYKGLADNTLSFIYTPVSQEELSYNVFEKNYSLEELCKCKTRIVMHKNHPLANKKEFFVDDLKELTYIMPAYDSGKVTTKIAPYFKKAIRYADMHGILSSLEKNDFVTSFASFSLVNVDIDDYVCVPCEELEEKMIFSIIHRGEKQMSLAERKVLALFRECFDDFIKTLPKNFIEKELSF